MADRNRRRPGQNPSRRAPNPKRERLLLDSTPINVSSSTRRRKTKKYKEVEELNSASSFSIFKIFKGLFFLFALGTFILIASSIFLRQEVRALLNQKITQASSVVLSRPFPLTNGVHFRNGKVEERLDRLNYRKVETTPARDGEYRISQSSVELFVRSAWIKGNLDQKEGLFIISLNPEGEIQNIRDNKFNAESSILWLEPEVVSVLGDSSQKAVQTKKLSEFSSKLKDAIIATEDEHFYYHYGINPLAIIRASSINLKAGKVVQGGSTLTQQLAKNLFFSPERNILRKIKEAIAAVLIETGYTKNQILEMYLNEIFLGQEGRFAVHGFGEASSTFFGKDVSEITLAEAALLAGLVKAPTSYSPRKSLEKAKKRQEIVLGRMLELGKITREEHDKAVKEEIKINSAVRSRRIAPYFVDYLQKEISNLTNSNGAIQGSLKISSGLDLNYQLCAETAIEKGLASLEKTYNWMKKVKEPVQAALVSVIPSSGEIVAWVGGREFGESQFDRISQAKRQPGSTFKPFVYLTALDGNLNQYRAARTTSILVDEPISIAIPGGTWEPLNYDKEYRGEVTLRGALALSLNIPTVQIAEKVGIKNVAKTGALFGFGNDLPKVPSLALGAGEVTPLELASAYSIIANSGVKRSLTPYFDILDGTNGRHLFQNKIEETRIVDDGPVFIITDILRTAIESGTGQVIRRLGVTGDIAGKTGTTNDGRDSWFVGYSPRLLAVVWVGFDSNRPLKLTGAQAAAPIWAEYYKCIAPMEPELEFISPESVTYKMIDKDSRLLATTQCPTSSLAKEIFVRGTEPVTPCPLHP